MNISDCYSLAKSTLSERRYNHSVNVAKAAVMLAHKYGADETKAEIAGILHDITKELNPENQLQIISGSDIMIDDICRNSVKLYHAVSGAAFVKDTLHIDDSDIISAIRYHTTARASMSLLEKIIYIADFISEERDYEDVGIMRQKAAISLEDGMKYALSYVMCDLIKKGRTVHPDALAAYNELVIAGF